MATKKVNLNEFKEIIKKIIKEEIVKENSSVEQNKIINQLKGVYKYSQEEAKELVKQNPNMNATAIHKKKQDSKLEEEIINEIKNDIRYDDIIDNVNRVVTVFGGSVIKVIFDDNSSLTFDTNNGKRYQDSSERNKANFAVEVKRYIQKNHNGDNLKFLEEFQNFRNFTQTTESKKR